MYLGNKWGNLNTVLSDIKKYLLILLGWLAK